MRILLFCTSWIWGLSLACGSGGKGSVPADPPRVTLATPGASLAGTSIPLTVSVNGCERVARLELFEGEALVQEVPYQGSPVSFELPSNEVSYATGIAARLTLTARAECDDGRTGDSQPQGVTFLPVAAVVEPPAGSAQVVPDVFFAEGVGDQTTFVGCTGKPNGTTSLARVNIRGEVVSEGSALPFPCSRNSQFTDRHPVSGKRWMWDAAAGAVSIDDNLRASGWTGAKVRHLAVGPDGDALVYSAQTERVARVGHLNGQGWARSTFETMGQMLGPPVVLNDGRAIFPYFANELGLYRGPIRMHVVDYRNGNTLNAYDLFSYNYEQFTSPRPPPAFFNATGSTVYLPVTAPDGSTVIHACTPMANDCLARPQWVGPSLTGQVVTVLPFADGTRLAAIAAQHVWFLDGSTGALLNKDGAPVQPTGGQVIRSILPGKAGEFYLLAGSGNANALPLEMIAIDDPGRGELLRFETQESSLMAGVGDDGQGWLRVGPRLVRLLPLEQYRKVRP